MLHRQHVLLIYYRNFHLCSKRNASHFLEILRLL